MIESIINNEGWKEIESIIRAELCDKPINIKTDGKSDRRIALEVLASEIAAKKIDKILRKLRMMAAPKRNSNLSYK